RGSGAWQRRFICRFVHGQLLLRLHFQCCSFEDYANLRLLWASWSCWAIAIRTLFMRVNSSLFSDSRVYVSNFYKSDSEIGPASRARSDAFGEFKLGDPTEVGQPKQLQDG